MHYITTVTTSIIYQQQNNFSLEMSPDFDPELHKSMNAVC